MIGLYPSTVLLCTRAIGNEKSPPLGGLAAPYCPDKPLVFPPWCVTRSGLVINTDTRAYQSYRIGPGTYVPLMYDPTGGGAWCAALCDTLLLHRLSEGVLS